MANNDFIYTTYIKTTPEKLWAALIKPEFTKQYWETELVSDWRKGSKWKMLNKDGSSKIAGEVLESDPPKLLVYSWADVNDPADGSRVVFELEPIGELVCLKVMHVGFKDGSTMAGKVSNGWPRVLSNLKSFLESGKPLDNAVLWHGKTCGTGAAA